MFEDSLFHLLCCSLMKWASPKECHVGHRSLRLELTSEHQLLLEMLPLRYSRLRAVVRRLGCEEEGSYTHFKEYPSPQVSQNHTLYCGQEMLILKVCMEVRTLIENLVHTLSVQWFPKLSCVACVKCPCLASKACTSHKRKNCRDQNCIHFLGLNECLSTNTVWCEYFKVDTSFIRKYFPIGL